MLNKSHYFVRILHTAVKGQYNNQEIESQAQTLNQAGNRDLKRGTGLLQYETKVGFKGIHRNYLCC